MSTPRQLKGNLTHSSLCPHPPCLFNRHSTPPFFTLPVLSTLSTLAWELWQGGFASSCHLMSTPTRGQEGCILMDKWTKKKEKEKIFLLWDTFYWVSCSLMHVYCPISCTACYAPALVLAPVQCLIDVAALPSSSLSMHCSSAALCDDVAAIRPKGLSAIQGYLN